MSRLVSALDRAREVELLMCVCITSEDVFQQATPADRLKAVRARHGHDAPAVRGNLLSGHDEGFAIEPPDLLARTTSSYIEWLDAQRALVTSDLEREIFQVLEDLRSYPNNRLLNALSAHTPPHFLLSFRRIQRFVTHLREAGLRVRVSRRASAGRWLSGSESIPVTDPHVVLHLTRMDDEPLGHELFLALAMEASCRLCQDAIAFRVREKPTGSWQSVLFRPKPQLLEQLVNLSQKETSAMGLFSAPYMGVDAATVLDMCGGSVEQVTRFSCWRNESLKPFVHMLLVDELIEGIGGLTVEIRRIDGEVTALTTVARYPSDGGEGPNLDAPAFVRTVLRYLCRRNANIMEDIQPEFVTPGQFVFCPLALGCAQDKATASDVSDTDPIIRFECLPRPEDDSDAVSLAACCCGASHPVIPTPSRHDDGDTRNVRLHLQCRCPDHAHCDGVRWEPLMRQRVIDEERHEAWLRIHWATDRLQ